MRHKQKPDLDLTGILPPIFSLIVFLTVFFIWGPRTAFYTLGLIIYTYAALIFYVYYRTGHKWTLAVVLYMCCFGTFLITAAPYMIMGRDLELPAISKVLIVIIIPFFWFLIYLNFTRKMKWRGREILELAALQVEEAGNTFTERPMPAGKTNISKSELEEFARFFERNLLGLVYRETRRIVFMPLKYKNEHLALYNPNYNYHDKTWVAIGYDSNVSVNISKKDYLEYREDLAFDELCKSLGEVMIDFMELYIEGREVRIIDKMNEMRVNVFT